MNDKRNMNIKMAGSVNAHSKMNDNRNMNIKMAGSVNAHSKILDVYFYITVGESFIKRVRVRVPLPGLTLLMIYYKRNVLVWLQINKNLFHVLKMKLDFFFRIMNYCQVK
jgi:hypothetical protein